jgi:hypothetical protein
MAFVKAEDIEIEDRVYIISKGVRLIIEVRDIEYYPRSLVLKGEGVDSGKSHEAAMPYNEPIELLEKVY